MEKLREIVWRKVECKIDGEKKQRKGKGETKKKKIWRKFRLKENDGMLKKKRDEGKQIKRKQGREMKR